MREHPHDIADLELMKLLNAYGQGTKSWKAQNLTLREKEACGNFYSQLIKLVNSCFKPLINRVTSREMRTFTMHDNDHALKVAHLMWEILSEERRNKLTPPEIGLMVVSAYLHDLGMGLSDEERKLRLRPDSDIWTKIDLQFDYYLAMENLAKIISDANANSEKKTEALFQLEQAQEAILCADSRERHATHERYLEILNNLKTQHSIDPINIPDIDNCLSFDGDSFENYLIEICVSHNEDASVLLSRDNKNPSNYRFPSKLPVGCANANTQLIAALLRLADILDFDRERTPPVLYNYLLPRYSSPSQNVSLREWGKHMAISNWEINDDGTISYNVRCKSAIIHHAILAFISAIKDEIVATKNILEDQDIIRITDNIKANIVQEGYSYHPYHFSLDENEIYKLLMGKELYNSPLLAVRELLQNAVDACLLKDNLIEHSDPSIKPSKENRIKISYKENSDTGVSILSVIDSGIGMDKWVIEKYLLKVGKSYYKSPEFTRTRAQLRKTGHDFAPVSEFGIGLLSAFMLCDKLEIETSIWSDIRNDTNKRILNIDGLGRLIEVKEITNNGFNRFSGTHIHLFLKEKEKPTWQEIKEYLKYVAQDLEYPIELEYSKDDESIKEVLLPQYLDVVVPPHLKDSAIYIPVNDNEIGLKGEIVLFRDKEARSAEARLAEERLVEARSFGDSYQYERTPSVLLRGGFAIGPVPGLPTNILTPAATARIRLNWKTNSQKNLLRTNITRERVIDDTKIKSKILETWTCWLLNNLSDIETNGLACYDLRNLDHKQLKWLESFSAWDVYRLIRVMWMASSAGRHKIIPQWEKGQVEKCSIATFKTNYHWQLIDIIMPRVCDLEKGTQGTYYLRPPKKDWKETLLSSRDFISNPILWNNFTYYSDEVKDLFYYSYPGSDHYNNEYEKEISNLFTPPELDRLMPCITKLIDAKYHKRQIAIPQNDAALLNKILPISSKLKIGSIHGIWTLSDLLGGLDKLKI